MKGPDDSAQQNAQKEAKKQAALAAQQADAAKALQQRQDLSQRLRGSGVGAFLSQGDQGQGILKNQLGV